MQTSNIWKQHSNFSASAGGSGRPPGPAPTSFSLSSRSTYSAEQSMFLQRLQDLLEKRRQVEGHLARDDWRMRLLDKALYSTYCDCMELEIGDEARQMLHEAPHARPV